MIRMDRFLIGIRTAHKNFRVQSLAGAVIDAVLDLRGTKEIPDDYYTEVSTTFDQGSFFLKGKNGGNLLRVTTTDVHFIKDAYGSDRKIDFDEAHKEFSRVWSALNSVLNYRDIRRIGLVAEHQFSHTQETNNKVLFNALSTLDAPSYPQGFHFRFGDQRLNKGDRLPDMETDAMTNVILDFYDSRLDTEHPSKDSVNANLDYQRYYTPLLKGGIPDEVLKLRKSFLDEKKKLDEFIKDKGLQD